MDLSDKREVAAFNSALDQAMNIIQARRERVATNLIDDFAKGQRGQDRCDALYDAWEDVRSLKIL